MRSYAFKILAVLAIAAIIAQLVFARVLFEPPEAVSARPVETWSPTIENGAELNATANGATTGVILARPLFAPNRKPYVAQEVVAEVAEPPPPLEEQAPEPVPITDPSTMSLKGIFVSGNTRSGFIVSPDIPEGKWYSEGTVVLGWKIGRFQDDNVILTQGSESFTLKQYVDNSQLPLGPVASPQ
jgi:type II secretory pathway component PulC